MIIACSTHGKTIMQMVMKNPCHLVGAHPPLQLNIFVLLSTVKVKGTTYTMLAYSY